MQMLRWLAAAIALACANSVVAADAADAPISTLSVTGQGHVSHAPDVATVALAIVTNDENATRALSENNRRFAELGAKLARLGIAASDVSSTSVQSYFNPRPKAAESTGQLYGFVVTRNAQINVSALAQTGAAVDAATSASAAQINGISYGLRDRPSVERAALAAAVADAYAQAQTIASAAHVQIVRILRIGDEAGGPGRIMPMALAMSRAAEAPVPTTITPTDLEVTSSVSITYVIR